MEGIAYLYLATVSKPLDGQQDAAISIDENAVGDVFDLSITEVGVYPITDGSPPS